MIKIIYCDIYKFSDYVSWSILSRRLSSESLLLINLILFRLYLLEQHERSLNDLVNEVKNTHFVFYFKYSYQILLASCHLKWLIV